MMPAEQVRRVSKPRHSYLEGLNVAFKVIDFDKARKLRDKNKAEAVARLNKALACGAAKRRFLETFFKKYESLTGETFLLQPKRYRTYKKENGETYTQEYLSDRKRLGNIMDQLGKEISEESVVHLVLQDLMERWNAWDEKRPYNLIGSIERSIVTEDIFRSSLFRARQKLRTARSIHNMKDSADKQRAMFG